jgi:Aldo/keto reductase family
MGHLLRRARLIRVVAVGALIAALTSAVSAGGAIAYGVVAVGGGSGTAIGRGASSRATASPSAGAAQFITDLAVLSQHQVVAIGKSSFFVSSDGGATMATAVSFSASRMLVIIPLIAARTEEQFRDNLAATDVHLSQQHLDRLDALSRPTLGFPADVMRDASVVAGVYGAQLPDINDPRAQAVRRTTTAE